jgi:glycosyltransferase involved in cell wall biosynthesis
VPPKVSVFTPVFNRVNFLRECVASVLSQSFTDFEYVISDNCSDDGSHELALEAAAGDQRVRVRRNGTNLGMHLNMTLAYRELKGEYVIMVCSDDLLLPGALAHFVDGLDRNPQATLATSSTALIDVDGGPLVRQDMGFNLAVCEDDAVIAGAAMAAPLITQLRNVVGNPPLYRRALVSPERWEEILGRFLTAGDVALYVDLLSKGDAVYFPEALRAYRIHARQFTQEAESYLLSLCAHGELVLWAREVGLVDDDAFETRLLLDVVRQAAPLLSASVDETGVPHVHKAAARAVARLCERIAAPTSPTQTVKDLAIA